MDDDVLDAVEQYLKLLGETAQHYVERGRTTADFVRRDARTTEFPDLVALRVGFIEPQDRVRVGGLAASSLYADMRGDERLAAFIVLSELGDEIVKRDIARRFARYELNQPLFARFPRLWPKVRDGELVPASGVRHFRTSGLVEVFGGWARIDAFLPPALLNWVQDSFSKLPLFIRLDPWFASSKKSEDPLEKAAVRPARPGWWRNLSLRNRERDGAHYVLQPPLDALADDDADLEYAAGVRTLEVHAQRDGAGRLSLMIEELVEDRSDSLLVGRCIHFDTAAPSGTTAIEAQVLHLDLAINVYFGEDSSRRRAMKLSDGKVQDASVRTHLLRIERAPFASSAEFARQFFKSSVLLTEWMRGQFDGDLEAF